MEQLDSILPFVENIDVGATLDKLKETGVVIQSGEGDELRWAAFKDGISKTGSEAAAYRPLEDIHQHVRDCATFSNTTPTPQPTTFYKVDGSHTPYSSRGTSSKPDAYYCLAFNNRIHSTSAHGYKDPTRTCWYDIAVAEEFKTSDGHQAQSDNFSKVVWSLNQILRNDPRRQSAYGMTIEDRTTRVWYCNRQVLMRSAPFDFVKDVTTFVKIILSFSFASPETLGWDPSVKLVERRERGTSPDVFDIQVFVEGTDVVESYRTTGVIAESGAEGGPGRGTRVFEVVRTDDPDGQAFVLKDYWIDADRNSEAAILENILSNAAEEEKKHFLTIVSHGFVRAKGKTVNTRDMIHGIDPSAWKRASLHIRGTSQADPVHLSADIPEGSVSMSLGTSEGILLSPKHHYRLVFREKCISLYQARTSKVFFKGLIGAIDGLKTMFHHGSYVHRDISPGNILYYKGDECGKLADLEYAKRMGSEGKHGARTGTPDFVATEIARVSYVYATVHPLVYNPLHDLESIWWVAFYGVFWFVQDSKKLEAPLQTYEDIKRQEKFSLSFKNDHNYSFLCFSNLLVGHESCITDKYVKAAIGHLKSANVVLQGLYREAERKGDVIDEGVFRKAHDVFSEAITPLTTLDYEIKPLLAVKKFYRDQARPPKTSEKLEGDKGVTPGRGSELHALQHSSHLKRRASGTVGDSGKLGASTTTKRRRV